LERIQRQEKGKAKKMIQFTSIEYSAGKWRYAWPAGLGWTLSLEGPPLGNP